MSKMDIYDFINNSTISTRFDIILSKQNKRYKPTAEDRQYYSILFGNNKELGPNYISGEPSDTPYTLIFDHKTLFINATHLVKQFRRNGKQTLSDITSSTVFKSTLSAVEAQYNEDNKDSNTRNLGLKSWDPSTNKLKCIFKVSSKKPYKGYYIHPDMLNILVELCNPDVADTFDELLNILLLNSGKDNNTTVDSIIEEHMKELTSKISQIDEDEISDKIINCCRIMDKNKCITEDILDRTRKKALEITKRRVVVICDRYFDKDGKYNNDSDDVSFKIRLLFEGERLNPKIQYYDLDENDYECDNDEKNNYKVIPQYYIARDVKSFSYKDLDDYLCDNWDKLNIKYHPEDSSRYCTNDFNSFVISFSNHLRNEYR